MDLTRIDFESDRRAGLVARVISSTKDELEHRYKSIMARSGFVDRLMAGRVDQFSYKDVEMGWDLREDLEAWRDARRFFLEGADSPLDLYGSTMPNLCEEAVRDAVRPVMNLPWNALLLSDKCTRFVKGKRFGTKRRG